MTSPPSIQHPKKPRNKKLLGFLNSVAAVIIIFWIMDLILFAMNSRNSGNTSSADNIHPTTPQQTIDDQMRAEGWNVVVSNDTYYRFPTEEESINSSCGYYRCVYLFVMSREGCTSGFYVKADILAGDTPVAWTNEISAGGSPGETVVVRLEDYQRAGDTFRISKIHCLG